MKRTQTYLLTSLLLMFSLINIATAKPKARGNKVIRTYKTPRAKKNYFTIISAKRKSNLTKERDYQALGQIVSAVYVNQYNEQRLLKDVSNTVRLPLTIQYDDVEYKLSDFDIYLPQPMLLLERSKEITKFIKAGSIFQTLVTDKNEQVTTNLITDRKNSKSTSLTYKKSYGEYPHYLQSHQKHLLSIITDSSAALEARLAMIKQAKETIDMEYYIVKTDDTSTKAILNALRRKARSGVKVRLLFDDVPWGFKFDPYLVSILENEGIELKVFNPVWDINPFQWRNHRKMLIVDQKQILVGGRNLEDSYYSMNKEFNFDDHDIWVSGPLVPHITKSYDQFWYSKFAEYLKSAPHPRNEKESEEFKANIQKARKANLTLSLEERKKLHRVRSIGKNQINGHPTFEVNKISYISDRAQRPKKSRILWKVIYDKLAQNKGQDIIIEAPYFIMLKEGKRLMRNLLGDEEGDLDVLANSRHSIKHSMVSIAVASEQASKKLVSEGLDFHGYSGERPVGEELPLLEYQDNVRWELHGKSVIFNPNTFMVSTYNFDPRSKKYNAEVGFLIEDAPQATEYMKSLLKKKVEHSFTMNGKAKYSNYLYNKLKDSKELNEVKRISLLQGILLNAFVKGLL